jgi:hypothetical protein
LSTPLPTRDLNAALSILRDHIAFIKTSPVVVEASKASQQSTPFPLPDEGPFTPAPETSPTAQWQTYDITDEIPRLGGLWIQRVEYQASMLDVPRGMKTAVRAPAGVEISADWTIEEGEGGGLVMREVGVVTCNIFLVPMIKFTLKGSHEEIHAKLVGRLKG